MNNLLEQANARMTELAEVTCDLEHIEGILKIENELAVILYSGVHGVKHIRGLSAEKIQELKDIILKAVKNAKEEKTRELERLLGIEKKPTVINPKIEKAVQDKVKYPYKVDHITEINGIPKYIEEEVKLYPVESKPEHPEMTVELVKELYHAKDMTLDEVAKEFGVSRSYLYSFVTKNNLRKPSKREQKLFRDAEVEKSRNKEPKSEKERP